MIQHLMFMIQLLMFTVNKTVIKANQFAGSQIWSPLVGHFGSQLF